MKRPMAFGVTFLLLGFIQICPPSYFLIKHHQISQPLFGIFRILVTVEYSTKLCERRQWNKILVARSVVKSPSWLHFRLWCETLKHFKIQSKKYRKHFQNIGTFWTFGQNVWVFNFIAFFLWKVFFYHFKAIYTWWWFLASIAMRMRFRRM